MLKNIAIKIFKLQYIKATVFLLFRYFRFLLVSFFCQRSNKRKKYDSNKERKHDSVKMQ